MSTPSAPTSLMSAEEFAQVADDDGVRRELVAGAVLTMIPAGGPRGLVAATLLGYLHAVVRPHRLGGLFAAETGFVIGRDPDTVRAPDLAFIRAERMPDQVPPGFAQVVPDLVAEVVSPADRAVDVVGKALAWVDAGVLLVWVVDPQNRTVTIYRPHGVSALRNDDVLSGEDVVEGLRIPLPELWS